MSKAVFINLSPKKHFRWANSSYMASLSGLWVRPKEVIHFTGKKDYNKILNACLEAKQVVFVMPVYVDAIPAHAVSLLNFLEENLQEPTFSVYIVTNCGFFEGSQCTILMEQMKCWCEKTGIAFGGGMGFGAGEMLGILRLTNILIPAAIVLLALPFYFILPHVGHSILKSTLISFGVSFFLFLLWSSELFVKSALFGKAIACDKLLQKNIYGTVWMCGKPLFKFFANLFWIIRAIGNRNTPKDMLKAYLSE